MENTSKALPGAGSLISDAWRLFTSTWNTSIKTSSLIIAGGVVTFVARLLTSVSAYFYAFDGILSFAVAIYTAWVVLRVYFVMLNLEAGKQLGAPAEYGKRAWSILLPFFWVSFLAGLVVLGASLLFIIPGIYFGVALYFSQMIVLDQGTRGTQALAASRALVRGRWWSTLWRIFAGGLVFGLVIGIISGFAVALIGGLSAAKMNGTQITQSPLFDGTAQLVWTIIYAATAPLIVGYQIKVYRALQKTR